MEAAVGMHAAAAGAGWTPVMLMTRERGHLAGALAVEEIAGVHAIQQERVGSIALAVGPDGRVAQAGVRARAAAAAPR